MPRGVYKHKPPSEETKRKMSEAHKGRPHSKEHNRKVGEAHKGRKATKEHRIKISKALKGRKIPYETRLKMGKAKKGLIPWNKGKTGVISEEARTKIIQSLIGRKHSEKTKNKLSERKKKELNPNWHGGISFEPYSVDWTYSLKKKVRQRDNNVCQRCGKTQEQELIDSRKKLPVHHVDYNKMNCIVDNLITLCKSCHTKTNKNRKHWTNYFNLKIQNLKI